LYQYEYQDSLAEPKCLRMDLDSPMILEIPSRLFKLYFELFSTLRNEQDQTNADVSRRLSSKSPGIRRWLTPKSNDL
jgi:hypothetical protein